MISTRGGASFAGVLLVLPALLGCGKGGCADGDRGIMGCVDRAAYVQDLTFVAQPRTPGSEHWQAVQDLCASRLSLLGFEVERERYGTGTNVIGTKRGGARANERIVVGAHYDHIAGCPGADDNASGVAGLLEVARVLSSRSYDATLVVACWDEEERGLIGSRAYAQRARGQGDSIVVDFTFDGIGYKSDAPNTQTIPPGFDALFPTASAQVAANEYRADFVALIADEAAQAASAALVTWAKRAMQPAALLELPQSLKSSPLLADLRRSDHAAFWDLDVPAVFLTDTANFRYGGYHCKDGPDTVDRLDHAFAARTIQITAAAIDQLLGRR